VIRTIDPQEAKRRMHSGGEIAFLDVREAGEFGEGHPLFAVPCPYSRLELVVEALVPNKRAEVVIIDGGDGVAERAARRLQALGYHNVLFVADGAPGWEAAGFTLFKGVNVPSKTLGELAEAVWHPAMLDATTLAAWRETGREFRIFDARPPAEFAKMSIPGASCLPNGELAHRFAAAVPDAEMPVVVNCAGRTRGIIGAIGLRLAGIENPVAALENGTQGWALAGEELRRGEEPEPYPELDGASLQVSRERAQRISEERRIPWIDESNLEAMRADADRTTYLFDVRSAEEFQAGHLAGAAHAPGGQLVQATDQWIGIRRARVVLCDDTGLRAALAAFWLRQLGFETYMLPGATGSPSPLRGRAREGGSPPAPRLQGRELARILTHEAAAGVSAGTCRLLDLRSSQEHRASHPMGSHWTIRPRIGLSLSPDLARKDITDARTIVLLSDEPPVAALAAIDLAEFGYPDVRLLEGGMAAWRAASLPIEASPDRPAAAEAIDFLRFVHDRHDGNIEASRQYLAWEQGLVAQLDDVERMEFRLEQPAR
jgi:rhodanese-related sulfurtransferase